MQFPFAFGGTIRPLPYAAWSLGVFFSQHIVVLALSGGRVRPSGLDWWFYLAPVRRLMTLGVPDLVLTLGFAYTLIAAWVLAAQACRRAADANIVSSIAILAIVPIIQVAVILCLCCLPPRATSAASQSSGPGAAPDHTWAAAALGLVAGIGLTLLVVAVGALVFRVYGYGLFVISPLAIGIMTGYLANRKIDIGGANTAVTVLAATALGGIALVMVALEGLICIIMAAPLAFLLAFVGGEMGRAHALQSRHSAGQTLSGFALLPVLFALESVLGATTTFDTYQTIGVAAPPEVVWRSIVRMDAIDEPPALPFRLGIAYPLRGEVIGEGVGALRRGEFSTGPTLGRVTEWVPDRRLAFEVLQDVPAMRELSPYQNVHAPHVVGYFRTLSTSFELAPRADGGTDLVERTSHELRLEPAPYWLPMARWVVQANNARVLAHIRRQAERSFRAGA